MSKISNQELYSLMTDIERVEFGNLDAAIETGIEDAYRWGFDNALDGSNPEFQEAASEWARNQGWKEPE